MLLLAAAAARAGVLAGQFVYLLNNGPETDFGVYNGANNGQGLTLHTAQVSAVVVACQGRLGTTVSGYVLLCR
jgi:hypothetical protein